MGNKLCAPLWKKPYRDGESPWYPKKDSHLLRRITAGYCKRLWAEIFKVTATGEGELGWERVSEDVVPVNITCIQDNPGTVFQVTAYSRHVEKIFDTRLVQPGTRITQSSECFVHWKDLENNCEWGLNFTTALDARRFIDCCETYAHRVAARKATSSTSLRLSPPKKLRTKKATSAPNSPASKPRRTVSSPEDLAHTGEPGVNNKQHGEYASQENMLGPKPTSVVEGVATMPRMRQPRTGNESVFGEQVHLVNQPPSNISVYDNLSASLPRKGIKVDNATASLRTKYATRQNSDPTHIPPVGSDTVPRKSILKVKQDSFTQSPVTQTSNSLSNRKPDNLPNDTKSSDKPPIAAKPPIAPKPTKPIPAQHADKCDKKPNGQVVKDSIRLDQTKSDHKESKDLLPVSPRSASHSSESPEWPAPPEPLSPCSPEVPNFNNATFDSDTLKRMLQCLPISPNDKGDELYHEFELTHSNLDSPVTQSQPVSPVSAPSPTGPECETKPVLQRTQSLRGRRDSKNLEINDHDIELEFPVEILVSQEMNRKGAKATTDYELRMHGAQQGRDSYPDSGISGMTYDTLQSMDSKKSATMPPGLGLLAKVNRKGSKGSHSSSGSQRGLTEQATLDVRPYLPSSEISCDEDSDDEESDSSIHTLPSESQSAMAKRTGAIRKAGWLVVKNWLMRKKRRIELAPKRTWKKYWVCLKGTVLLFFLCDEHGEVRPDAIPRHLLVIEGGIAQAVPEHPKREYIFALSTAYGDAYLFQAQSNTELENWICAIHSACASSFARQHGKDNTLKLLKSEVVKLENSIDMDVKMKKMAELQMSVVSDPRSKQAIVKQIAQWDENLEKLYVEQFRFRCYTASLQGTELPNPKNLLSNASKTTKTALNRLGVFTMTAFHALVSARSPVAAAKYYKSSRKKFRQRPKLKRTDKDVVDMPTIERDSSEDKIVEKTNIGDCLVRIQTANKQQIVLPLHERVAVEDLLEAACLKRRLNDRDHYLRFRKPNTEETFVAEKGAIVKKLVFDQVELCQKIVFQCELVKLDLRGDFGLHIEAELSHENEREDELRVFINDVRKASLAEGKGLQSGDEILVINGKVVAELDMVYIEGMFQERESVTLTIRSCRSERPFSSVQQEDADKYIETMVVRPPPSTSRLSEKTIAPSERSDSPQTSVASSKSDNQIASDQISNLLQSAEQVTDLCRKGERDSLGSKVAALSDAQRLRKCIMELIETERAYVKDLNCLIERYLEPLKAETFLSSEEIEQLFGNIQEIVQFQRLFLRSLEEAIEMEPDFLTLVDTKQFRPFTDHMTALMIMFAGKVDYLLKVDGRMWWSVEYARELYERILFSLGGSFLYYANHFKLYSSFCASHSKAQKVLNPDANEALRNFLRSRNPHQQHSATLESYLIKPIQRILKYPLLLQQLKSLTVPHTEEHYHLSEALKGMETVAEHINEMQKIYEEYGAVFYELMKLYKEAHPSRIPIDLNIGELQMYGIVEWLNASVDLGKIKKGQELITACFVFKAGVVLMCKERIKQKKKKTSNPNKAPTPEIMEFVRFQTLIPVNEVQVRSSSHDVGNIYMWELVHLKSEVRPEKVYQLANSTSEAKNDFLRTIRQIIRESVRRMSIPKQQVQKPKVFMPSGVLQMADVPKNPRSIAKRRIQQLETQERHSMDFTDHFNVLDYEADFRTRSKTLGNLHNMELGSSQDTVPDLAASSISQISTTSSNSQVSSQTTERPGSAKLLYSSNNPLTYSYSSISNAGSDLGSPIWKPRQIPQSAKPTKAGKAGKRVHHHPKIVTEHDRDVMSGASAYGDYAGIMYNDKSSAGSPSTVLESVEDTEC